MRGRVALPIAIAITVLLAAPVLLGGAEPSTTELADSPLPGRPAPP